MQIAFTPVPHLSGAVQDIPAKLQFPGLGRLASDQ